MGRKAKPGLGYHKASGQYYKKVNGKFRYFGRDKEAAYAAYLKIKGDTATAENIFSGQPFQHMEVDADNRQLILTYKDDAELPENNEDALRQIGVVGFAVEQLAEKLHDESTGHDLKWLLKKWKDYNADKKPDYLRQVEDCFNSFIDIAGNKDVERLTVADFREWKEWLNKQCQKRQNPASWRNKKIRNTKPVFSYLISDWIDIAPDGLSNWQKMLKREKHKPAKKHALPIPADDFKRMIKVSDSKEKALFMLMITCGFNCPDVEDLDWGMLHLSEKQPYFEGERRKVAGSLRRIPLPRQVVAALRAYRQEVKPINQGDNRPVFLNRAAVRMTQHDVRDAWKRVAKRANIDNVMPMTNLRNCFVTAAKNAKVPREIRQAFLGHLENGTNVFYEGEVGPEYVSAVVNAGVKLYF